MKKFLLLGLCLSSLCFSSIAVENVELNGKVYEIQTLSDRDLGPGVRYTRLRIPDYPLNVNMLRIDVTNPYVSVETQQASEKLYSTESLVNGAKRNSYPGHVALAGANANFWCVSGQAPYSDQLIGVTYNGNLKNGKIITETNCKNDMYNGGLNHTGITGVSVDGKVYSSNNFSWEGWINSEATGALEIFQCNKIVRDEEIGLYNSFYPTTRTFRCVNQVDKRFEVVQNVATEVYLSMDAGEEWSAGDDMKFTVKEVRTNAGNGTLGNYDLALVGRGSKAQALAKLKSGDKVTINYSWIGPDGKKVKMNNLVGGNAQVLVDGELTKFNDSENYNSQVYSRTGYGCNADGTMLYIIVIDKASDAQYGASAGCPTKVMCQLAMHYGCTSMTNFDAGGSAMMMVGDKIINKTTEGSPRAVANGMVAFSIAPEDNVVSRLEFFDYELKSPIYATSTPRIIAYNKYGAVISDDFKDAILSCPAEAGSCNGNSFTAGSTGINSELTASYNGVSVTKPISIVESELTLRIKPLLIDLHRSYPIEVTAMVDNNTYIYNPSDLTWTVSNNSVVKIENGVLTGIAEGSSVVTGSIGDFTDATNVTVEEPKAALVPLDGGELKAEEWSAAGSSVKNIVFSPKGANSGFALDFDLTATRGPYVSISKDIRFYSLPDALEFTINPGTTSIKNIIIKVHPANELRPVDYTYEETLTPSSDNKVTVPLNLFADTNDLISFPITFKDISIYLNGPTGAKHIDMSSMHVVYNNFTDAVNDIIADGLTDDGQIHFYNLNGVEVNGENLVPGIYIKVSEGKAVKTVIK